MNQDARAKAWRRIFALVDTGNLIAITAIAYISGGYLPKMFAVLRVLLTEDRMKKYNPQIISIRHRLQWLFIGTFLIAFLPVPIGKEKFQAGSPDLRFSGIIAIQAWNSRANVDHPYLKVPKDRLKKGTGILLKNGFILTNLDVVRYAVTARAIVADRNKHIPLEIVFRAFDCNMALLRARDETLAQKFGSVSISANVPEAGSTLEVRTFDGKAERAILSYKLALMKRELLDDSDTDRRLLMRFQNEKSAPEKYRIAGAPIFYQNQVVGIVHRGKNFYGIHSESILHVIRDIEDGKYNGFPLPGFYYSPLSHSEQQAYHSPDYIGTGSLQGVVVRRFSYQSPAWLALRPGDIIAGIDGYEIDSDGIVQSQSGRTLNDYIGLRTSQSVTLRIIRRSSINALKLRLKLLPSNRHNWLRKNPETFRPYLIVAGLGFQELNYDLLRKVHGSKHNLLHYRYKYHYEDRLDEQADGHVILSSILSDRANHGSERYLYGIAEYVNNRRIRNLKDFQKELEISASRYISIRFADTGAPLLLKRSDIKDANRRIMRKYDILKLKSF